MSEREAAPSDLPSPLAGEGGPRSGTDGGFNTAGIQESSAIESEVPAEDWVSHPPSVGSADTFPRKGGRKAGFRTPGAIHTSERAERAAKRFRRSPTAAEKSLWSALRRTGLHFRRQAPFGPYIVDFVSHGARLIIEVDGGIHDHDDVKLRDAEREAWLRRRGYAVVRVTNEQALFDPAGAAERIIAKLDSGVHNSPPSYEGRQP